MSRPSRVLSAILAAGLLLALGACGKKPSFVTAPPDMKQRDSFPDAYPRPGNDPRPGLTPPPRPSAAPAAMPARRTGQDDDVAAEDDLDRSTTTLGAPPTPGSRTTGTLP